MEQQAGLVKIYTSWVEEDKNEFRSQVFDALYRGLGKNDILDYRNSHREGQAMDEDFEEWAYMFVVSSGASDCAPG